MRDLRFGVDHRFTQRRLSDYVDVELEPAERRRVERHVGACEDCGRAARSLARLVGGLRLLGGRRPSQLAEDAIARVRAGERPKQDAARR